MLLSRRSFTIIASTGLTSLTAGAFLRKAISFDINYRVPAASMKERAIKFRSDFINKHLIPKTSYPIFEVMHRANLLPLKGSDTVRLGGRGSIEITEISANPHSRLLINDKGSALEPRFVALINDQNIRLRVRIPKPLKVRATYDSSSLAFQFESKLIFILEDKIQQSGVPLPIFDRQILDSLSLSDNSMVYQFVDDGNQRNKLRITLDFNS